MDQWPSVLPLAPHPGGRQGYTVLSHPLLDPARRGGDPGPAGAGGCRPPVVVQTLRLRQLRPVLLHRGGPEGQPPARCFLRPERSPVGALISLSFCLTNISHELLMFSVVLVVETMNK